MTRKDESIFLLNEAGGLERVPRVDYDTETILQSLVDDHPDLLAGEQIQPEDPVRWLVITREAGVPDSEGGSDRWSVDHLLLDQYGRPTFVEVKRSKDPRIRREVVGQMLDYAANALAYWPVDRIRSLAAERYGGPDDVDEELGRLLSPTSGEDPLDLMEAYWQQVEENLRNGRVRLLFVADELPRELRRVIEFLNEQMQRVEVLGVEVRQYVGENLKALVPRLVGQTESARQGKRSPAPQRKTDPETFLSVCPEDAAHFFSKLLQAAEGRGLTIYWGTKGFSIRIPRPGGRLASIFYGYPPGTHGKETAFVEAYMAQLNAEDDPEGIRRRFLAAAPFRKSGQYTLQLILTPNVIPAAEKAASVLFAVVDELIHRQQ